MEQILWKPLGKYSSNMADVHGLSFSRTGGILKRPLSIYVEQRKCESLYGYSLNICIH